MKNNKTSKAMKNNKSKKVWRVIGASAGVVVLGIGSLIIALKHENIESWFNHQQTYSHEEVQHLLDENNKLWELKLKNLLNNSDELKNQLSDITSAKVASDARVSELAIQLENARATHSAEVEGLESLLQAEQATNASLDAQIYDLNATIESLEAEIEAYKQIIAQYETEDTASVSFYNDDGSLIYSTVVDKGTTCALDSALLPQSTENKVFKGFSVDEVLVDYESYVIDTATTFTAVYDTVYTLTFNYNDTSSSIRVINGELEEELPEVQTETDYKRYGWRDEAGNYITDANLTTVTSNLNLTPNIVQQRRIVIKYRLDSGTYTEYTNNYVYAAPSLNSNGEVSTYFLVQTNEFNALVTEIEEYAGGTATGKCFSLVESQDAYLSSIGNMDIGSDTSTYYVYLTLS